MKPPYSNTGVVSRPGAANPLSHRTKVDALAISARGEITAVLDLLEGALSPSGEVGVAPRKNGWQGFEEAVDVLVDEASVGLVAWGGESQRGAVYFSLMGTGCALAGDVQPLVAHAQAKEWPIRRVDIAADFVDGSVSIERVVQAHSEGKFRGRRGPSPQCNGAGPLDGSSRGRTVYIGTRSGSDKFLRAYEKGLKELPALLLEIWRETGVDATGCVQIEVDGRAISPADWFRVEVEFKAENKPIPYDIVQRRDEYFAGAYPFLAEILPGVEPAPILSPQLMGQLAVEEAKQHIRRQCGAMLYTLLTLEGGDVHAVWRQIVGSKHSESMTRAGALLGKLPKVPA